MSVEIVRGTVTQASPLRVRVDGATSSSAAESFPSLYPAVGERVRLAVLGSTLLVLDQGEALPAPDTRTVNDVPSAPPARSVTAAFKQASVLNIPGAGVNDYAQVLHFRPWADDSGGGPHQIAVVSGGAVWHRYGTGTTVGGWGPWERIGGGDSAWTNASLASGWANYATATGDTSWALAGYRKDALGWVHLRGLIRGPAGSTAFTLPAGYRPGKAVLLAAWGGPGVVRTDVRLDGAVVVGAQVATGGTTTDYTSLEGFHFLAEA